jgi:hypothetical protein
MSESAGRCSATADMELIRQAVVLTSAPMKCNLTLSAVAHDGATYERESTLAEAQCGHRWRGNALS